MAVQADEFRDLRSRAIAAGNVPDVAEAPHNVLANILKGRIEDLTGWALFNQSKHTEAITHLKVATETLPAGTPSWRTALWHLGAALEQSDKNEEALDYYIKSYNAGDPDPIRRSVIEQLYKKMTGSLDGLEQRMSGVTAANTSSNETPAAAPATEAAAPATETAAPTPSPETSPSPETPEPPKQLSEEEAMKMAASRIRSSVKITGRVLDANKVGIANATVILISPTGMVLTATTDNDGNYSFMVAAPSTQKTYRIIPSKDGYAFAPIDKAFAGLLDDQRDIDFIGTRQ
jgi:hypothetical protein